MNEEFLKEHGEKIRKALLKQPKLSQAEMLRQAKEQMGLLPQKKSESEKSKP